MKIWPFTWLFRKSEVPQPSHDEEMQRSRSFRHDVVIPKITEMMTRLDQIDQEAQTDVGFFPEDRSGMDRSPHPNH